MHTGSNGLTCINLPVRDVRASREFFSTLGFTFDDRFSDEQSACLVLSDKAFVMLLEHPRFEGFVAKEVGDPTTSTACLLGVSAASREAVDALADSAFEAGATSATEPVDYGFMYGRSFYDLDGHHWELIWMSEEAVDGATEEQEAKESSNA